MPGEKRREFFILSNNHVLANSNAARSEMPSCSGPYDGGRFPDDHIANLEAFIPISFTAGPADALRPLELQISSTP